MLAQADLLAGVRGYYEAKLARHGPTPLGVDWTCRPTQELRFARLAELIPRGTPFSVNDVGCGYGALLPFLRRRRRGVAIDYLGTDLSGQMVEQARRLHGDSQFETGEVPSRVADYCLASGVFNVKLDRTPAEWERYVAAMLRELARKSRLGFAVNFLQAGSAAFPPELYATQPQAWLRHCRQEIGGETCVLSGYGLREFTLLVRAAR